MDPKATNGEICGTGNASDGSNSWWRSSMSEKSKVKVRKMREEAEQKTKRFKRVRVRCIYLHETKIEKDHLHYSLNCTCAVNDYVCIYTYSYVLERPFLVVAESNGNLFMTRFIKISFFFNLVFLILLDFKK